MKYLVNLVCGIVLCSVVSFASAEKLATDSPEFKQLVAMGYDLQPTDKDFKVISIFTNGDSSITFERSGGRLAIWRTFSRKKIDATKELQLLKLVNSMNINTTFQVSTDETSINYVLYLFGPHNSRALSIVIRLIEKIDFEPELLKLLNNE